MNIFFVDRSPRLAAIALVDRHVTKMIVESAQLLSTAHRVLDGDDQLKLHDARESVLYRATHRNHPSAVWVRSSVENYLWLVEHTFGLLDEYAHRYGKKHKTGELMYVLQSPPHALQAFDFTEPPCAMPDEFLISSDPVENYRAYYRVGKSSLHSWKNRTPPEWINDDS